MTPKTRHYKTAVVCMVYDGYEYISEFMTYYLHICDHLYIIDHNSQRDLRHLSLDRVTVVRSNHEAQFQSECTNSVIEHFGIKDTYDWVFVLDIDEFLPFSDPSALQHFLHKHRHDNVVKFYWRNGVPFYDETKDRPQSLIDCQSIRFFHKPGRQYKTMINIRKTKGLFFVPTGAHTICRIMTPLRAMTPFLKKRKDYIPAQSKLELYHIVAFNKSAFVKKIKNYMKQFAYRAHVARQGGGVVGDYPDEYEGDEWLWYIANFRVKDPQECYEVQTENFIPKDIFSHLNAQAVKDLRAAILSCNKTEKQPATAQEQAYLAYKTNDREVLENIKWFTIDAQNEVKTIHPPES